MSEVLYAYWQGFTESGTGPDDPPTLALTPACVDIVALAFAVPGPGSTIVTDFLTSKNSKASILADSEVLRARGQKVVMSVNGSRDVPWDSLDPKTFAASVKSAADEWGLDGIDLDNETPGTIPGQTFVDVIKAIRDTMGDQFLITYPAFLTFRDQFLAQVKDEISLVMTMAYWNDYDWAVSLYSEYAKLVGPEKVCIGVKPGYDQRDQSTPFDAVAKLAAYEPTDGTNGGTKGGMMLYSLTLDVPATTQKPRFTWVDTIAANVPRAAAKAS